MAIAAEVECLKAVPLFNGLDPRRLKLIAFTSDRMSYEPGAILFRQGDDSDAAFVILEGKADVMIDTPAGQIKVATLAENSLVGEMGVMTNSPRSATIVAESALTTLRIPKEMFMSLVTEFSQVGLAVIRELASRVEHTNRLLAASQRR
ncbi:MAG: cyclic nucleotide-binding domain-containing protein [Alsobacter sp.]